MKILRDPCSSFQYNDEDLDIQLFCLSLYYKITITLRSHVVVLSVTLSCGYPRGDVFLILDGWLVEEYRVLRDSMLHEVSTPLFVTHQYKFKSQVRVILLQYQVHHIGFFSNQWSRHQADRMIIGLVTSQMREEVQRE